MHETNYFLESYISLAFFILKNSLILSDEVKEKINKKSVSNDIIEYHI